MDWGITRRHVIAGLVLLFALLLFVFLSGRMGFGFQDLNIALRCFDGNRLSAAVQDIRGANIFSEIIFLGMILLYNLKRSTARGCASASN